MGLRNLDLSYWIYVIMGIIALGTDPKGNRCH